MSGPKSCVPEVTSGEQQRQGRRVERGWFRPTSRSPCRTVGDAVPVGSDVPSLKQGGGGLNPPGERGDSANALASTTSPVPLEAGKVPPDTTSREGR